MTNLITLTDAAVTHILQMAAKVENAKGFRLSLKKTGCSGYAYVPNIIQEVNENDFHFVTEQGLHVYVDREHENFLNGLVVDYVSEQITNSLKQKRLVFINPHEKNRCGCGESFTTE